MRFPPRPNLFAQATDGAEPRLVRAVCALMESDSSIEIEAMVACIKAEHRGLAMQ